MSEALAQFDEARDHEAAGRPMQAIDAYRRAIRLKAAFPEAYNNVGHLLRNQGLLDDALTCLRAAIKMRPGFAGAHYNVALALADAGRLQDAMASFERAIALEPDFDQARFNLGNLLSTLGRGEEAACVFRELIGRNPAHRDAWNNLGTNAMAAGRCNEAIRCFGRALAIDPEHVDALFNNGACLAGAGQFEEAIACLRKAIAIKPDHRGAYDRMGQALSASGHVDDALTCYRTAVALDPACVATYNNLGNVLLDHGRAEAAIGAFEQALVHDPAQAATHFNLGNALRDVGRTQSAIASYHRALDAEPDHADAHFNLSRILLSRGEMSSGWRHYEWRWQTRQMRGSRRAFAQPQWSGEPIEGRTLLIHAEQGYGDTLQFCRYAAMAGLRGARVLLQVQAPLVRLLRSLPGIEQVLSLDDPLPAFDLHCPMLSLPLAFATTITTVPAVSYLHPDPREIAAWRARLAVPTQPCRVGIAWAGSPTMTADHQRSLAFEQVAPLLDMPGLSFVSLQAPPRPGARHDALIDPMDEMHDFASTAAVIANLDLVISVDTAVAHLASTIGTPVWLMDRFKPCWRWLDGRCDSPWYPAMRIYRQSQPDDWASVLAAIARDLQFRDASDRPAI